MLERLNIPMWVSSNQKIIFLLVLPQQLLEGKNFLFHLLLDFFQRQILESKDE